MIASSAYPPQHTEAQLITKVTFTYASMVNSRDIWHVEPGRLNNNQNQEKYLFFYRATKIMYDSISYIHKPSITAG